MKVKEAVKFLNETKPSAYTEEQLVRWLSECEGMVQTQVFLWAPPEHFSYSWPEDEDTVLLVDPPFDKLYLSYLCAKIDFANGEYSKYQNSMQMFNSDFSEFMRWFANSYRPADTNTEGMYDP